MNLFDTRSLAKFAECYPETPHRLQHELHEHPLLELDRLAKLAESLPASSLEYNFANQPIGVDGKPEPTGIPIGHTIRDIANSDSWAVIKNIEQVIFYPAFKHGILGLMD